MATAGEDIFTEAQLAGEDNEIAAETGEKEAGTVTPTPEEVATKEKEEAEAKAKADAEAKAKEEADRKAKEKAEKTVPLSALHEERKKRQELARKLAEVEKKLARPTESLAEIAQTDLPKAFEALEERLAERDGELTKREIETEIRKTIPDFDAKAPLMDEFLLSHGFSEDGIVNMVAAAGRDAPRLFSLINSAMSSPTKDAIREELKAELEAEITERITKELTAKLTAGPTGKNLGKLPGSAAEAVHGELTEAQMAKLSPEELEKYLDGET